MTGVGGVRVSTCTNRYMGVREFKLNLVERERESLYVRGVVVCPFYEGKRGREYE